MTEMVEKVARIICIADGGDPDISLGGDGQNFLWHEYERTARAAIEAMMEPTWQMCSAGSMEHSKMVHCGDADIDDPDCRYIFEAMLKAALEPVK